METSKPTSTLDLVERVKRGDPEGFTLLFRKYRGRLAALIYYRMGQELRGMVEVDDILQETFLVASRQLPQFNYQSPGSFMAWLSRIADHAIVDSVRFYGRQKRDAGENLRLRSESNVGGLEPADFNTPSRIFAYHERLQLLVRRLDDLSPEQREVLLLTKFEGLSMQEVSARIGKPRNVVALLLHRALKRFRQNQTGASPP